MDHNLDELKGLVAAIKADHQAQKDKEKRDSWTKYVSLSMIFLAVLAAVATQKGAGYSSSIIKQLNEATFNQAEASDQWAYYQAKGIKQSLYELEREHLTSLGDTDQKTIASLSAKVSKYDAEKKSIAAEAKAFEDKRNDARVAATKSSERGQKMGLAITIFQISIAMGGVCLVVKKRWLWASSLLLGTLALAQMLMVLLST
jgi:hypothetical protein